jgi:4-hydroxy-3-polyprenylbenzoate decarboxylase
MVNRIVIGITGASGVIYGIKLLAYLKGIKGYETHLILSDAGRQNIAIETTYAAADVAALADHCHAPGDIAAPLASGSFLTHAMVVVPCTIKTLSAIAHSYNDNLLVRAADVHLKERRKLALVVRETPLHLGHLRLMCAAVEMGAHLIPPIPAFYHQPKTIDDIIDQTIGKILDFLEIPHTLFQRWKER